MGSLFIRRCFGLVIGLLIVIFCTPRVFSADRPNILLAISDDQSFYHTSKAGYPAIQTPAFDRIANEGVYFTHAVTASPGCSPSRAALLTGRYCWQLEDAATHASGFPTKYVTYPDLLEAAGYFVGFTGKGWGPGDFKASGRSRNPAGPEFADKTMASPDGINSNDYAANFGDFLKARKPGQPFCFWYGGKEPHRTYKKGIGLEQGKRLEDAKVPGFLPDAPEIRSDLLDYCAEIEWFDAHLGRMIAMLEQEGELDNTIVIVTADNGMSFPRAKANVYEAGIRMPLAIRWGAKAPGGRTSDDLISLTDLAPTLLEAAGVTHPGAMGDAPSMVGKSMLALLISGKSGVVEPSRDAVFSARERHSSSRYNNWGYPQRGIRTAEYLYVRNYHPDRWPAGDPQKYGTGKNSEDLSQLGPMHDAYHDIDAGPSLTYLVEGHSDPGIRKFLDLAVGKRPAEELYAINTDPDCLVNLATHPDSAKVKRELSGKLDAFLKETGDPRATGEGEVFETYPRFSEIRKFPAPDSPK
ncbi:MAG: sulfatase [Candidatus Hydrogenedentes bacterium]|nr:sulfatase [Candidatus Hydrogenedentota bacterium]